MFSKVIIICMLASRTMQNQTKQCGSPESVDISVGNHSPDGSVYFQGDTYDRSEYFVDEDQAERGCICLKRNCVRKCCERGLGYDIGLKKCVSRTESSSVVSVLENRVYNPYFLYGKPQCRVRTRIRAGQGNAVVHLRNIRPNGKLYLKLDAGSLLLSPDKYCVDTFITTDNETGAKAQVDALICFEEATEEDHFFGSICMLISCVFLLMTVAVYGFLPELQNLHGKVLMSYLTCLFVAFAFLATMQLLLAYANEVSQNTCLTLTFIIYFFLETAFFWLNVMCFDIWWTFSGKRGHSSKMSSRVRFRAYCAYAFGMPALLTLVMGTMQACGLVGRYYPNMYNGCFLYKTSKQIYLYGPMVILCVANSVFFILTAWKIAEIKKQTSVLKSKESSTHDVHRNDKQRFLLYVKLFAIMGINWILEVVSASETTADLKILWKITDAYNVLIGLIVFIIFVCKRKTLRLIKKRIKDTFSQDNPNSSEELPDLRNTRRSQWANHHQRASRDTIRTTIDDTDSVQDN